MAGEGVVFTLAIYIVSALFPASSKGEKEEGGRGMHTPLSTSSRDRCCALLEHGSSSRRTRSCRLVLCSW